MHYLISILNIFYISFFISLLFFGWSLYLFFKEKFKEASARLFVFHTGIYFIFCNLITYLYVEDLVFLVSIWLEENFIVKDPNDWVWALFTISLFLTIIFFIPYMIFMLYILSASGFYWNEQKVFSFFCLFLIYNLFLSLVLLLKDFIFAGVSSLAQNKKLPFEFQLEIENFVLFVFGTYGDFFFTILLFNLFIFNFLFKNQIKLKKFYNIEFKNFCFGFILIFIFYWFGGVSFIQDIIMLIVTLLTLEFLKWLKLFLFFLSKYNKN